MDIRQVGERLASPHMAMGHHAVTTSTALYRPDTHTRRIECQWVVNTKSPRERGHEWRSGSAQFDHRPPDTVAAAMHLIQIYKHGSEPWTLQALYVEIYSQGWRTAGTIRPRIPKSESVSISKRFELDACGHCVAFTSIKYKAPNTCIRCQASPLPTQCNDSLHTRKKALAASPSIIIAIRHNTPILAYVCTHALQVRHGCLMGRDEHMATRGTRSRSDLANIKLRGYMLIT